MHAMPFNILWHNLNIFKVHEYFFKALCVSVCVHACTYECIFHHLCDESFNVIVYKQNLNVKRSISNYLFAIK